MSEPLRPVVSVTPFDLGYRLRIRDVWGEDVAINQAEAEALHAALSEALRRTSEASRAREITELYDNLRDGEKVEMAGCGKCASIRHADGRASVGWIDPSCPSHRPRSGEAPLANDGRPKCRCGLNLGACPRHAAPVT